MKHFSRVLCLLLMLALLLPGALAEAVEQTEQIDSGIEEDEVEKVGDIFDMYQVGSMVEANGKLWIYRSIQQYNKGYGRRSISLWCNYGSIHYRWSF